MDPLDLPFNRKQQKRRTWKWIIGAATTIIVFAAVYSSVSGPPTALKQFIHNECPLNKPEKEDVWHYDSQRDADDYGLLQIQCDVAFPSLFAEVDRVVDARRHRPITEQELSRDGWPAGMMRLMIYDGQLYVVDVEGADLRRSRQFSLLHAILRAVLTNPHREPLPNIEFVISIEDWTIDETLPVWAFDRRVDQNETWLMPDFGFWAWPEPGIGSYAEVRKRIQDVEAKYASFEDKEAALFWRGAIVPSVAPILRQHLIDKTVDETWADVKVLVWDAQDDAQKNRVPIEDHCKYQYLMNTEGRAWSGRLKYIQNCEAVIVAHKFEWIITHSHLMVSDGAHQNFVQVEPDFSDLKDKMEKLIANPAKARTIAENSARTFRDRYLSPAAEACYWRKLIRGWSQVSFEPRFYDEEGKWRGVPADTYILMRTLHWEPH